MHARCNSTVMRCAGSMEYVMPLHRKSYSLAGPQPGLHPYPSYCRQPPCTLPPHAASLVVQPVTVASTVQSRAKSDVYTNGIVAIVNDLLHYCCTCSEV